MTIEQRAILIRIPRLYRPTMTPPQLYEATRKWWVVNPSREPDYAFCIVGGVVKAVYRIDDWKQPPESERVGRLERRWAFSGANDAEMERRYVGVDVTEYFPRGAANPVRYVRAHAARLRSGGGVVSGARVFAGQECETRLTVRIEAELCDGMAEVGRIEIDVARHLDPRVSMRVLRLEESRTGLSNVTMS